MATAKSTKTVSGVNFVTTVTYSTSSNNTSYSVTVSKVTCKITADGEGVSTLFSPPSSTLSATGQTSVKGTLYSQTISTYTINFNKTFTWNKTTTSASKTISVSIPLYSANDSTDLFTTATVSFTATVPALASYAVKYAANGGSSTPSQQTKYYGQSLTLATAISHANTTPTSYKVTYNYNGSGQTATSATANVTRKWTFSKWKASDGTLYNGGGSYTANTATTMTAQWTTSDTTAQLTLPTPNARTGYTFAGWYTAATGGSSKGGAGAKFTPTTATTLYAHWTGNSYAVNYDANGGTGAPSSQTRTYGTAIKLSTTKPTRIGHTFLGWATTSSASSVQYAPGASYNPSTAAATKLYAVWKSNYVAPKITSLTAIRCNSSGTADDEGSYAKVTAVWSTMQSIDQNKTNNYGIVTGKTKASDSSSNVTFTFSSGAGGSGVYSGTAVAIVPNMSTEKSYRVTVTVDDAQGGKSVSRAVTLTASFFTMDFAEGGRGVGILEAAPTTGVTIGGNTTLHGNLNTGGNLQIEKNLPYLQMNDTALNTRCGQVGAPNYTGRWYAYDANNKPCFYTETTLLESGTLQRSFVCRRYSADGETEYNNGFYLRIDGSGNPEVTFSTGGAAAWRAGLGVLPLSGGTITGTLINTGGSFVYKNNSLDRDGAAPSADLWGGGIYFQDKDGANWAYLRPVHRASGRHDVQLAVFDQNGEANGFQISRSNGVNSYWMTDTPAFRTAIGCGSLATKDSASLAMTSKDGTASSTAARSANTNFTIDVTLAAVSGYTPISVVAVKLNAGPATVMLRGYDLDGLSSGGTPTVHTYWHTSAAIASGTTVTAYAQVMYLRGTAS